MNEGGETSFELIQKGKSTTVCLEDHGTAIATDRATGELRVKRADRDSAHVLTPVPGGNCLAATAVLSRLKAGDMAEARVRLGNGSVVIGRFAVK